jgi:hypothetical protein
LNASNRFTFRSPNVIVLTFLTLRPVPPLSGKDPICSCCQRSLAALSALVNLPCCFCYHIANNQKAKKARKQMIFVPAATPTEVVVDSFVNLVLVSLLSAIIVVCCSLVILVVVSVPSTLATLAAFVSQVKSTKSVEDDDDDEPMAIELTDVDEEVSSDEEEEADDDDEDDTMMAHTDYDVDARDQAKAESAAQVESAAEAESKPRKRWFRFPGSKAKRCFRFRKPERKRRRQIKEESSPAPVPEKTLPRKRVSFGVVQVQEYGVILGDSPSCKGGYPLGLDWAHTEPTEYSLDAIEQAKASSPPRRGMGPNDRMLRIATVAGIAPADVQKQERKRSRKAEKETYALASSLSDFSADEADDGVDVDVEVSVSCKSLGAFQF